MRICIAAPIATADVWPFLAAGGTPARLADCPAGYEGAPLTAVLIGELLARGHEVLGLTLDYLMPPQPEPVVLRGPRFEFRILPGRRRAWRGNEGRPGRALDLFRVERAALREQLEAARPDLVHAHWTYEFALAALDTGLPTLVTAHDAPSVVLRFSRSPYRALRWLMAREVLRRAPHLTTVSGYMAGELAGGYRGQIAVVPNPVAAHVLAAGRARAQPATRRIGLVCNGWGARKNPTVALQAFARFRAGTPSAELHCFGDDFGPGQQAERWAGSRGLAGGVHFHGRLPHAEMVARLATQDVLLHPALEESFGVVVAEAMALGLPVVGGRASGAVPWVLGADAATGATAAGVLTDVADAEALAAALAQAFDAGYGARSAAGLAQARQRFGAAAVADAYLEAYARVIGHTPGPAAADGQASPRAVEAEA